MLPAVTILPLTPFNVLIAVLTTAPASLLVRAARAAYSVRNHFAAYSAHRRTSFRQQHYRLPSPPATPPVLLTRYFANAHPYRLNFTGTANSAAIYPYLPPAFCPTIPSISWAWYSYVSASFLLFTYISFLFPPMTPSRFGSLLAHCLHNFIACCSSLPAGVRVFPASATPPAVCLQLRAAWPCGEWDSMVMGHMRDRM